MPQDVMGIQPLMVAMKVAKEEKGSAKKPYCCKFSLMIVIFTAYFKSLQETIDLNFSLPNSPIGD